MKLLLKREPSEGDHTFGQLFVDGAYQCETLEDVIREVSGEPVEAWKIVGKTAIPAGTYAVTISFSPHFQCNMPLINAVPGFAGVRIHPGNTSADTEGCVLVGDTRQSDSIGESRAAFESLYQELNAEIESGGAVSLTICNP